MPRDFWKRTVCDILILGSPWGRRSRWKLKGGVCPPGSLGFSSLQGYPQREKGFCVGLPLAHLTGYEYWEEGPAEAGSPADCTVLGDPGLQRGERSAFLASGALEK